MNLNKDERNKTGFEIRLATRQSPECGAEQMLFQRTGPFCVGNLDDCIVAVKEIYKSLVFALNLREPFKSNFGSGQIKPSIKVAT